VASANEGWVTRACLCLKPGFEARRRGLERESEGERAMDQSMGDGDEERRAKLTCRGLAVVQACVMWFGQCTSTRTDIMTHDGRAGDRSEIEIGDLACGARFRG